MSLLGWKLGSGAESKRGTMDFHYWENVLLSQFMSFYRVLACAVWGSRREKRLFWAPALEQMSWRNLVGYGGPLRTWEDTEGAWGQEEGG